MRKSRKITFILFPWNTVYNVYIYKVQKNRINLKRKSIGIYTIYNILYKGRKKNNFSLYKADKFLCRLSCKMIIIHYCFSKNNNSGSYNITFVSYIMRYNITCYTNKYISYSFYMRMIMWVNKFYINMSPIYG